MRLLEFKDDVYKLAANVDVSQEQIERFISDYFLHKPIPIVTDFYSHVVRAAVNADGEVFSNIGRCSYNPNINSIPLMRCNYPQQQVFYATLPLLGNMMTATTTALLETTMKHVKNHDVKRKYLTLSRWSADRPMNLFIFPFSRDSIERSIEMREADKFFNIILSQEFSDEYAEAREYFRSSLEFMSEVFATSENKAVNYRISAAFYNSIMKFSERKGLQIDGMIYSSANTLTYGLNVVLRKELVDQQVLACDYVQMFAMQRTPNDPKEIGFPPVSTPAEFIGNGKFTFCSIW